MWRVWYVWYVWCVWYVCVDYCGACDHLIAEHEYTCDTEDGRHETMMNCMLCGNATDSRAYGVYDPEAATRHA